MDEQLLTVTVEQVTATLKSIVAEKPNYVYEKPVVLDDTVVVVETEMCMYIDPGTVTPSCLIGHLMVKLGVQAEALQQYEGIGVSRVFSNFVTLEPHEKYSQEVVVEALAMAQDTQDLGSSWGAAFKMYKEGLQPW